MNPHCFKIIMSGGEIVSEKIDAVQRMQTFIETHLTDEITLADMAEAAHFSPWYAARIFKELTHLSPADYVRRLKLSKSALRLRDEQKLRIIDIAFEMGFVSVDGYQRAFLREFGCNPKEYANHPFPLPLFTSYGVKYPSLWKKEMFNMEQIKPVFIQKVEKPARKVIIKRAKSAQDYWSYCEEVGCDVWGILSSIQSLSKEPVCLWLPERFCTPNTSKYVQGVEVAMDEPIQIPDGFDVIELPAAVYLRFQGEAFAEEDYCEAINSVQSAMDRYDPKQIDATWDDTNPRIQLEPIGTRGYIELRAIK